VSRAHNPLADRHALHAVNLITAHLLRTQLRPKESRPRVAMAQGSRQAGMALTNAMLGATHAMSHQVGGLLDAPQGLVNGVLLPHIIRFNAQVWPHRFVPLAAAGGIRTEGVPADEVALILADRVRQLADEEGVPNGLAELGVTEAVVSQPARTTLKDACLTANPREADAGDIEALFRAAL
jgi:alcohol dehydrogenase class IV